MTVRQHYTRFTTNELYVGFSVKRHNFKICKTKLPSFKSGYTSVPYLTLTSLINGQWSCPLINFQKKKIQPTRLLKRYEQNVLQSGPKLTLLEKNQAQHLLHEQYEPDERNYFIFCTLRYAMLRMCISSSVRPSQKFSGHRIDILLGQCM